MESTTMNFFVQKLHGYFSEGGKELPPYILGVLSRPFNSLGPEEAEIYNRYIGPYQAKIRAALSDIYQKDGSPHDEWASGIHPYYRPIIEVLAAQVLGLEGASALPQAAAIRTPHKGTGPYREGFISRLRFPQISLKWIVIGVIIIAALVLSGWLFFYFTAPSRLFSKARGEGERGEYAAAIEHFEEFEKRYPNHDHAGEAGYLKADAALKYAGQLIENGEFEEAIDRCKLADGQSSCVEQADLLRTQAYFGWAGALKEGFNYTKSYECCESALHNAPESYDTAPIKALRAEVLFGWGNQLWGQKDYEAAVERFQKCYTDWPTGPLANQAMLNYVDMAAAVGTKQEPPSKNVTAGGHVEMRMFNPTNRTYRVFFSGPSTMFVDLAPGARQTVYILPGVYSTGYFLENVGQSFQAGEDYSQPTTSRSWWEVTMPSVDDQITAGVGYEGILARIEELKPTLPDEIAACINEVEYELITDPERSKDIYADYDPLSNAIGFACDIPAEELDGTIFHEWGHAYSDFNLDLGEKEEYKELRNINTDTAWENNVNYYLSVEEDFAEVFEVIFGNTPWVDYTWYGPVVNVDELKGMILAAA